MGEHCIGHILGYKYVIRASFITQQLFTAFDDNKQEYCVYWFTFTEIQIQKRLVCLTFGSLHETIRFFLP